MNGDEFRDAAAALAILLAVVSVVVLVAAIWASAFLPATKLLLTGGVLGLIAAGLLWRAER